MKLNISQIDLKPPVKLTEVFLGKIVFTLIYLLSLTFLRWRMNFKGEILFFLGGGILGVYFLDLAEAIFKRGVGESGAPSSFKNVLFQAIFVPFSLFVLTSSGSLFGAGLVLSIFLNMLFEQGKELKATGNLNSWFRIIKRDFSLGTQRFYFLLMLGIFVFLSSLFV